MTNRPLISIVINCFNGEKYLKKAINSVICQTYDNWEIVFWDNMSTDNSLEIVNSFKDERIKYFRSASHTQLGEARNLAISKCRGQWIGFLDSDDMWHCEKLTFYLESLSKYSYVSNVSLIYSRTYIVDKLDHVISGNNYVSTGYIHNKLLKKGNFIVFSSVLIHEKALKMAGNISESLNFCEDYELLLKITNNHFSIGIDKYLTYYRVHSDSITTRKKYDNSVEYIDFLIEYTKNKSLKLNTIFYLKVNITYAVFILIIKQILEFKYINFIRILLKYFPYLILSIFIFPLLVIKKITRP